MSSSELARIEAERQAQRVVRREKQTRVRGREETRRREIEGEFRQYGRVWREEEVG